LATKEAVPSEAADRLMVVELHALTEQPPQMPAGANRQWMDDFLYSHASVLR
jgi:hypothetical protein